MEASIEKGMQNSTETEKGIIIYIVIMQYLVCTINLLIFKRLRNL